MRLPLGLRRWLWHLLLASVFILECGCGDDLDLGTIPPFTHVYVANLGSHTVSVIDLKSFKNVKTIAVGKSPNRLAASPIDDLVFTANLGAASISVIDANTHLVKKTIPVGKSPADIVFSSDGRFAFVACYGSNTIAVIDCEALLVVKSIKTQAGPVALKLSEPRKQL